MNYEKIMENKTMLGSTGCMFGTIGAALASAHVWITIICALLTGVSIYYTIVNARAKGKLQELQIEHEAMMLCMDCQRTGANGQCSIPPDKRPLNCPKQVIENKGK